MSRSPHPCCRPTAAVLAVFLALPSAAAQPDAEAAYEEGSSGTNLSPCIGPLSPQAAEVSRALPNDGLSRLGRCNYLPAGWLMNLTGGEGHPEYAEEIGTMLAGTKSTFSFVKLDLDSEDNLAGPILNAMGTGLCALQESASQSDSEARPVVRIFFSKPTEVNHQTRVNKAWERLLEEYAAAGCEPSQPWRFHLAVRSAASLLAGRWSHAKLTVSDGQRALTGSVESVRPELAMKLVGPSAGHAATFYERIWGYSYAAGHCRTSEASLCGPRKSWKVSVPSPSPLPILYGASVFSLARAFEPSLWGGDQQDTSADKGVLASFDAARDTIFISQTALASNWGIVDVVVEHLTRAAIRGVDVKMAVQSEWGQSPLAQWLAFENRAFPILQQETPSALDYWFSYCRLKMAPHGGAHADTRRFAQDKRKALNGAGLRQPVDARAHRRPRHAEPWRQARNRHAGIVAQEGDQLPVQVVHRSDRQDWLVNMVVFFANVAYFSSI